MKVKEWVNLTQFASIILFFLQDITQILIENSADIFKLSVDIFHPNDIPDQASSLQDAGRGHHVRRESVSGKIKGTWSKIRGKKSAGLKNDDGLC